MSVNDGGCIIGRIYVMQTELRLYIIIDNRSYIVKINSVIISTDYPYKII